MPNPWKKPNDLAKLLDIKPGEAREVLRQNANALKEAKAAKRNGHDPKIILQDTTAAARAEEEGDQQAASAPPAIDKLQAIKALYDGYQRQDIEAIAHCIETVGGVGEFRQAKELLDSLQYA